MADLRPNEPEARRGRRRLSQELSRIQRAVGKPLWESSRGGIEVRRGFVLTSDVGGVLRGARPEAALANPVDELNRLESILQLVHAGEVLAGHDSEWVDELRSDVKRAEVQLLRRIVALSRETEGPKALSSARRWSELDPFDDNAHAEVAKQLESLFGGATASEYVAEVGERYQRELGAAPDGHLLSAIDQDRFPLRYRWVDEVDRLMARYEQLSAEIVDVRRQVELLRSIDQLLRAAGHHRRRPEILDLLGNIGADPLDLLWRRAEVAIVNLDAAAADELLQDQERLDFSNDAQAMAAVVASMNETDLEVARSTLNRVIAETTSATVVLEARILLADILDQLNELPAAEKMLLNVYRNTDLDGTAYCRASALAALGFNRIRAGDDAQAEAYFSEALDCSEAAGIDSAQAASYGGAGFSRYQQHRLGTALRLLSNAALISQNIGDVRSEYRWRSMAIVSADAIGDIDAFRHHFHCLQEMVGHSTNVSFSMRYGLERARTLLLRREKDFETSIGITRDIELEAQAAGHENIVLLCRFDIVRQLFDLERFGEALVAANSIVSYIEHRPTVPPYFQVTASAVLGAALTAAGDPHAGIEYLRKAADESETGQVMARFYWYWLYVAAAHIGMEEEAQATLARIERLLNTIRSDLTEMQWKTALADQTELRNMASLLPASPT